jgi:hypothetical protein
VQFVVSTEYRPVHEEDASGLVASVYRDVRARMAFVPAIFKALAADPGALLDAWLQARALHDDPRSPRALERLRRLADPGLPYRPSPAVSDAAAPFAAELPAMLLVVSSLGLALDGSLAVRPRPPADLPDPGPLPPTRVPEERGEHPMFREVRAVYGTQHVPSMYRALAAAGLLEEPWSRIGPLLAGREGRELVTRVAAAGEEEARRFPEYAYFAHEGAGPVLAQFRIALPYNLVFAAAASRSPGGRGG